MFGSFRDADMRHGGFYLVEGGGFYLVKGGGFYLVEGFPGRFGAFSRLPHFSISRKANRASPLVIPALSVTAS